MPIKDDKSRKSANEEYFASLEQAWTNKAEKEKRVNQLVVAERDDPTDPQAALLYDVLHINDQGIAKRVGGFHGGSETPNLSTAKVIEDLGLEGIRILQEQGFEALHRTAEERVAQIRQDAIATPVSS